MANGHGGTRENSGKKAWNHPDKRQKNQPVLGSFFSNPSNDSTNSSSEQSTTARSRASTTRTTAASTQSNTNSRSRSLTSQRQHQSSSRTSNSSSKPNTGTRSRSTPARASSSSRATSTPRQRDTTIYTNLPNNDVDVEDLNDIEFKKGKRIDGSINLQTQQKSILKDSYRLQAFNKIQQHGIFWDHPPSLIVKPIPNLKRCWMEFFKLPVFNWIPEAILGTTWKPHCPNCKKKLTRDGVKLPPRLVFGLNQNYWLNAPQKYACHDCRAASKESVKKGGNKIIHSFYDTSEAVLKQIEDLNPELCNIFPCHLRVKNAIDKDLMDLIIHSAVKGVGPAAMAETIASFHELLWQKKENEFLRYLYIKLKQPAANQQPIRREDIEKCPEYFSLRMGGCVPSKTWLIEMLCLYVRRLRPVFDSECIKRAKSSKVLSMDASYKLIKWMMMHGVNEKVYNALISGLNEYNEIPMQIFATSDNHEEIRANLEKLAAMGLNPLIAFTDDPGRDESLLKSIFSNLNNGDDDVEIPETVPEDLTEMTTKKELLYLYEIDKATLALSKFRQDIEDALNNTIHSTVRIAFDAEWPVYRIPNSSDTKGDINILTLGSNVTEYTLLLEIYSFRNNNTHMDRIGQKLKSIFSLPVHCFTGCRQKADYSLLQKQYKKFDLPEDAKKKMDDVSIMAVNRGLTKRERGSTTLQALCRDQKIHLKKPACIRIGTRFDSTGGSLNKEAQTYCQLDVEAPLLLHSIYSEIPDMTLRATKHVDIPLGTVVDIMPELESSVDPIAQGVVVLRSGSVWSSNRRRISSNQVLVKVEKVFNGKGIIHYPCTDTNLRRCSCGRATHNSRIQENCDFYLFSQFGRPTFNVVSLKSRLRLYNEAFQYPSCIYADNGDGEDSGEEVPNTSVGTAGEEVPSISVGTAGELLDPEDKDGDSGKYVECEGEEDIVDDVDDVSNLKNLAFIEGVLDKLIDDDNDPVDEFEDYDDGDPSPAQVENAINEDFSEILEKIIEEADKLSVEKNIIEPDDERDVPIEEADKKRFKRVMGDIFHFMDRAKLPMHHEYKALFFRALRAAIFIMNQEDVNKVKEVLKKKPGWTWEKTMAFKFRYIAARVRRIVPPPQVLYNRMVAVFNFFRDKKDSETGHTLFHETNKKRFENMLEMIKQGYASDPEGIAMYVPKTDRYGRNMVDADGLQLYRSIRGTSNLESLHQYLTTSFGHTNSGPWYSDSLLTLLRHHYNWRMSRKNRPNFPQIGHYDSLLLDRANNLYELVFGHRKHRNWSVFNENLPIESAYGVVPINEKHTLSIVCTDEDKAAFSKQKQLVYLAERQKSPLPFLPIKGENEARLVHKKLNEIVLSNESFGSRTIYEKLAIDWNTHHLSIKDKRYPKLPSHFMKYVKGWKRNQNRRDAEINSGARKVYDALEYIPATSLIFSTLQPTDFSETNENLDSEIDTLTGPTATEAANLNLGTDSTETDTDNTRVMNATVCLPCPQDPIPTEDEEVEPKKKKRKYKTKTCQGYQKQPCPDPINCPGKSFKPNCLVRTGGDESKMIKREIKKQYERTCQECFSKGCPGSQNRGNCMYK